ncbi:uncharacterized protein LOC130417224 isoform X2 [Triplophysa dalaica]|uniref:uncharacterized protein LOC130417224 isoform X2 n=1 Tax=Triplophysa dalaica TaxID=1582913 RepID=UPI0024DF3DE8|nr:uncharacterized protein LOC130417224 isoform X2 [Triplophysa dalaica]
MSTQKKCHVCKERIGVASKTCQHCHAKQPYKQKLEKRKQRYAEEWISKQRKNGSVNKVYDATYLLLHKWEILDRYPVTLLAKRTTHGFSAECLCPWQMDSEDVKDAFDKIKRIYESLLNGLQGDVRVTFFKGPPGNKKKPSDRRMSVTHEPAEPKSADTLVIKTENSPLNQDALHSNITVALTNAPTGFNSEDTSVIKTESLPLDQDVLPSKSTALAPSAGFKPAPAKSWSSPRNRKETRNASECSIHQEETSFPSKKIQRRRIREESEGEGLLTLVHVEPESQASTSGSSIQSVSPLPVSARCASGGRRSAEPELHEFQKSFPSNPKDYDELYFMSLVGIFKRLSQRKKAEVRMKIERILYEAEFE